MTSLFEVLRLGSAGGTDPRILIGVGERNRDPGAVGLIGAQLGGTGPVGPAAVDGSQCHVLQILVHRLQHALDAGHHRDAIGVRHRGCAVGHHEHIQSVGYFIAARALAGSGRDGPGGALIVSEELGERIGHLLLVADPHGVAGVPFGREARNCAQSLVAGHSGIRASRVGRQAGVAARRDVVGLGQLSRAGRADNAEELVVRRCSRVVGAGQGGGIGARARGVIGQFVGAGMRRGVQRVLQALPLPDEAADVDHEGAGRKQHDGENGGQDGGRSPLIAPAGHGGVFHHSILIRVVRLMVISSLRVAPTGVNQLSVN